MRVASHFADACVSGIDEENMIQLRRQMVELSMLMAQAEEMRPKLIINMECQPDRRAGSGC